MAKFDLIQRAGHLPDLIASEIVARVSSGQLSPWDRLPPEQELATSFGVSRNVVREAIARLRSDGVVDTKPGRGAVVLPASARSSFRIDAVTLDDSGRVASLFELRGLLEIDAAGIAARRRADTDLAVMEAAIEDLKACSDFDEDGLEADAKFHRALGVATRNDYLATIIDYISNRLKETIRATRDVYTKGDLVGVTVQEHETILEALHAQQTQNARAAMANHIAAAANRLGVAVTTQDLI